MFKDSNPRPLFRFSNMVQLRCVHVCCTVITPLPSTTNPFYQPKSTTEAQKPPVGALKRAEPNGGEK